MTCPYVGSFRQNCFFFFFFFLNVGTRRCILSIFGTNHILIFPFLLSNEWALYHIKQSCQLFKFLGVPLLPSVGGFGQLPPSSVPLKNHRRLHPLKYGKPPLERHPSVHFRVGPPNSIYTLMMVILNSKVWEAAS